MINHPPHTAAKTLLRASLAVALFLPLAHPASAAQEVTAPLPATARYAQSHGKAASPMATLHRLLARAHRSAKKVMHFQFPYGLAADQAGNVFVTNYSSNSVAMISPTFKITDDVIATGLNGPVSAAVGPNDALYVGNTGSGGYIERYSGGTPEQTIMANAGLPFSIAVDAFDDLYIAASAGIAVDDENGNSLYAPGYTGYGIVSVAVGNGQVYGFVNENYLSGSGSLFLRSDGLEEITGPTGSVDPVATVCGDNQCWYTDSDQNSVTVNNGSNTNGISLPYTPNGIAYDQFHNRLFIADPENNAIHIYNAHTLALERTLT